MQHLVLVQWPAAPPHNSLHADFESARRTAAPRVPRREQCSAAAATAWWPTAAAAVKAHDDKCDICFLNSTYYYVIMGKGRIYPRWRKYLGRRQLLSESENHSLGDGHDYIFLCVCINYSCNNELHVERVCKMRPPRQSLPLQLMYSN